MVVDARCCACWLTLTCIWLCTALGFFGSFKMRTCRVILQQSDDNKYRYHFNSGFCVVQARPQTTGMLLVRVRSQMAIVITH